MELMSTVCTKPCRGQCSCRPGIPIGGPAGVPPSKHAPGMTEEGTVQVPNRAAVFGLQACSECYSTLPSPLGEPPTDTDAGGPAHSPVDRSLPKQGGHARAASQR